MSHIASLLLPINTVPLVLLYLFFFFNDTATTEIYTLSLHDALPISRQAIAGNSLFAFLFFLGGLQGKGFGSLFENARSEEHTSELQSQSNLVCRLLLEKKKIKGMSHSQ